jgi:serine/threonine-protein kinase
MPADVASSAPVREGDVVAGKYRVEGILGAGGMGVVVAARHLQLKQPVAIKFLLSGRLGAVDGALRFLREAESAARIQSEHVARVLDTATLEDGTPFIVMEFLAGRDLAALLAARGPLPLDEAVGYILEASEGIAAAHAAGVVHRDLKPSNFFLAESAGRTVVKVFDFGLSKLRAGSADEAALTQSTAILGSPLYMSPEQMASAKDVDERADIWSLGASLFELVTGKAPFPGASITEVVAKVMRVGPPPSAAELRASLPEGFDGALGRSLEKDRDRRYATIAEFAAAIAPFGPPHSDLALKRIGMALASSKPESLALAATQALVAVQPSVPQHAATPPASPGARTTGSAGVWDRAVSQPPVRRRRWGWIAGVSAALAVVGVGSALYARRGPTDLDVPIVSARSDVQDEFRRGIEAYLGADIEGAERAFKQVEADEPRQPWPKLGLTLTYAIEKRFEESSVEHAAALDLARTGAKVDPRDRQLVELLDAFDSPDFGARYARYLGDNPRYFLAQLALAYLGTESGPPAERIHRFEVARAIDDRQPVTYLCESWLHLRLGDTEAARASLARGLQRRSTAPWLLDQRGVLNLADGNAEAAKADFERATIDGPRLALVHYALALLRTGTAADEELRKHQVSTILALPSADLRLELAGQHVVALYARGRVADGDRLLAQLLEGSAAQARPGTILRSVIPPLWVNDALGRYETAQKLLASLEALLRKPGMSPDKLREAQWYLTAMHGIIAAETGKLADAHDELRSLSEVVTDEPVHHILVAELKERIRLHEGGPPVDPPRETSLGVHVRTAHLAGRLAEQDGDIPAAEKALGSLLHMSRACANTDLPVVLPCAAYVASGLARLARLQRKQGRKEDLARTLQAFDVVWPSPDADLEPVKVAAEARK